MSFQQKRTRQVNGVETADYLKRPRTKIADPNKDLNKAYAKNKQFDNPKFNYMKQLKQYRKNKDQDSVSSHGGTDDEDFDVRAEFKAKNKKKLDMQSDSFYDNQRPKRILKKKEKPVKTSQVVVKQIKVLETQKTAALEVKPTDPEYDLTVEKQPEPEQIAKEAKQEENSSSKKRAHSSSGNQSPKNENNKSKSSQQKQLSPDADEHSSSSAHNNSEKGPQPIQSAHLSFNQQNQMKAQLKAQKSKATGLQPRAELLRVETESNSYKHSSDLSKKSSSKSSKKDSGKGHSQSEEQELDLSKRLKDAVAQRQESDKVVKMKTFKRRRGRVQRSRMTNKTKAIAKGKQVEAAKIKTGKQSNTIKSILKQTEKRDISKPVSKDIIDVAKIQSTTKRVTIQISEAVKSEDTYQPLKTRAKINIKSETLEVTPQLRSSMRKYSKRAKRSRQTFTQMNLKGQIADVSKEAPFDSSNKQKQPEPEQLILKIEEGQKLIRGYMKPKVQQPQQSSENKQTQKQILQPAASESKHVSIEVQYHPKHGNLSIERKVIVESIILFCNPNAVETPRGQSKKPRTKVVMMQSEQDEPVEYIYKRRRPQKQAVRRYKKILYPESDEQDVCIPKGHKKNRHQLQELVEIPDRRRSRRQFEDIIVRPSNQNKRMNEISMVVRPQVQD